MVNDKQNRAGHCERFREELELVHVPGGAVIERGELLEELPAELRGHAGECGSCLKALDDVVETRNLLLSLAAESAGAVPSPWFASKVMNAIAAKERENKEQDGVWISVQKLAPRLAAVCALLLVLIGTWAMKTQREYQAKLMNAPGESLFDSGSGGALNDDVMMGAGAH